MWFHMSHQEPLTGVLPYSSRKVRLNWPWPQRLEGQGAWTPGLASRGRGGVGHSVSTCTHPVYSLYTHSWHTQWPHHKANAQCYLLTPPPPLLSGLTSTSPNHLTFSAGFGTTTFAVGLGRVTEWLDGGLRRAPTHQSLLSSSQEQPGIHAHEVVPDQGTQICAGPE